MFDDIVQELKLYDFCSWRLFYWISDKGCVNVA